MNVPYLLSGFGGRMNRSRFWIALLIAFPVLFVIGIVFSSDANTALTGWAWMILVWVGGIFLLVVSAKRLHDLNASSWWLLPLYGGPYAIDLMGKAVGDQFGELMASASNLAIIIVVLVLGLVPGSNGPNRFGIGLAREA